MTEQAKGTAGPVGTARRFRRPALAAMALLTAAGVGAGANALAQRAHPVVLVALAPVPVSALKDGDAAVTGRVAEVFGNKFVLQDGSGRALVETGRAGEGRPVVAPDEAVTVQGRFAHGFLHGAAITHADGRTTPLDPPPPPARRDGPPPT